MKVYVEHFKVPNIKKSIEIHVFHGSGPRGRNMYNRRCCPKIKARSIHYYSVQVPWTRNGKEMKGQFVLMHNIYIYICIQNVFDNFLTSHLATVWVVYEQATPALPVTHKLHWICSKRFNSDKCSWQVSISLNELVTHNMTAPVNPAKLLNT